MDGGHPFGKPVFGVIVIATRDLGGIRLDSVSLSELKSLSFPLVELGVIRLGNVSGKGERIASVRLNTEEHLIELFVIGDAIDSLPAKESGRILSALEDTEQFMTGLLTGSPFGGLEYRFRSHP